jgi:transcriptional regulator with XRE-family HTH domain
LVESNKFKSTIGSRLKDYRTSRVQSLAEFSFHAGIGIASLSEIENGKVTPSVKTLVKLYKNTNISFEWLLMGEGKMLRE